MPKAFAAAPYLLLLGLAATGFWLALHFEYPMVLGRLGPDAWPKAILVLLAALSLAGIWTNLKSQAAPDIVWQTLAKPLMPGDIAIDAATGPARPGLVAAGFLLFLAYPIAMDGSDWPIAFPGLGFPIATFVLMTLFMVIGQWRNHLAILATAALGTLALFYVFRGIVYVSLPLGTGPFLDLTVALANLLGMR